MDHSAAPAPYAYGQPSGYPPYPYPYPPASAAWPPGFDPAMLPYPDPRMYAGGVPGYYDPMAVRPPPSAADFYAAAAVSLPACFFSLAHNVQEPNSVKSRSRSLPTYRAQFMARLPGPLAHFVCLCPAAPHKQSAQMMHEVFALLLTWFDCFSVSLNRHLTAPTPLSRQLLLRLSTNPPPQVHTPRQVIPLPAQTPMLKLPTIST